MKTLAEKFNGLDSIMKLSNAKSMSFMIENNEIAGLKSYSLKYLNINEELKDKKAEEINEVIKNNEIENSIEVIAEKLSSIDEKYIIDKYIRFGTINCYLKDKIIVDIQTSKHSRIFEFEEEDYLDSLLNFLEKDINDEVKEIILEKNR